MSHRRALTITELVVVFAIIGVLLALLLPALSSARERAREASCKNNLRQVYLALTQLTQTAKKLPRRTSPMTYGGWMIEILPFVEQGNLETTIPRGELIDGEKEFERAPAIFICPTRLAKDDEYDGMWPAHYVLAPNSQRNYFNLYDAPIAFREPWATSPELPSFEIKKSEGPHQGRFHYIQNQLQGVQLTE